MLSASASSSCRATVAFSSLGVAVTDVPGAVDHSDDFLEVIKNMPEITTLDSY